MQGLKDLGYAVKEVGFVGAHLCPQRFRLAPVDALYDFYYARCVELDMPNMMRWDGN